jgi:hypothetical protein
LLSGFAIVASAQALSQPAAQPNQPQSPADMAAERERIWNSPNMLRARAWLQDYCSKSARITPEMAKRYQEELANMTPAQMELWLMKFEEEEQKKQQQYAFFQQANSAGMQRASAVNQAAQQSLNEFTQQQNQAALGAEQRIQEQREFSQSEVQNNMPQPMGPAPYMNPYNWLYGNGGIHYHYHYYP